MSRDFSIPHDAEAEAGALACVLQASGDEAKKLFSQLSERLFHDLRHLTIYRTLVAIEDTGASISSISLVTRLNDSKRMQEAGGTAYVVGLPDKCISPEQFPEYLRIVEERATRRAMIAKADKDKAAALDLLKPVVQTESSSVLPPFVDAAKFVAIPLRSAPEIVEGLLHKGSKMVIGGGSKSHKTWAQLDLALSVAHGRDWLGKPTTKGRVLYVNFEIQAQPWQNRIQTVAKAKGIEIERGAMTLLNMRGKAADFRTLMPTLIKKCREQAFDLIVLDPIYKLYGGTDENKAGDVAALLNSMESLSVETGAAVAFAAHFSKGNQSAKEAMDRISGSGVFARDPDSILILTAHEEEDAFTVEPILRNFAPVKPFAVRWKFPLFERDDELNPKLLRNRAGRKQKHKPDDLLKILPPEGLSNPEWLKLAEKNGISRATYYKRRDALEAKRRVTRSKDGLCWTPVPQEEKRP